ncbi:hydroxyacid dehydrogenase [bacterium]|nr:hydroxyacid dehydrogenase [bacterium]
MIWTNTILFDFLLPEEQVTRDKSKATSIILGAGPINIEEFPNVEVVFRAGVGADNINFSGPKVIFPSDKTKDLIYEETANFTCYLIFRMLYEGIGNLSNWSSVERNILKNKNLLIIGAGNIGSRVFVKMFPFIDNISTYDVLQDKTPPDYSQADVICLHIPSNKENENFINKKILDKLKDDAILINTARGAIVNEDDLYEKMKNSNLRAAFDVFWEEPYRGKLTEFGHDRFLITPHIASSSIEFIEGCYEDFRKFGFR